MRRNKTLYVYLPILLISLIKVLDSTLAKKFQKNVKIDANFFILFNIYNSIIACVYFFSMGGFKIEINRKTLVFSIVYAFFVAVNHLLTFLSYSKVSVTFVSVVSTAGSIIVPTVYGVVFFSEKLSIYLIVSLILLVLAVVIPSLSLLKDKNKKGGLWILLSFFFVSGILIIISKIYSVATGVTSSNDFFLMTNVLLFIMAFVLFFIKTGCVPCKMKNLISAFSFKEIANIGVRNIICDISAVITIVVLKNTNLGVFTIITYSMMLILSLIVSKYYFKEQIKKTNVISVILAVLAIIMNSI